MGAGIDRQIGRHKRPTEYHLCSSQDVNALEGGEAEMGVADVLNEGGSNEKDQDAYQAFSS